jgi:peptidoglycan/LPS O-acetylase OafA/YrhL
MAGRGESVKPRSEHIGGLDTIRVLAALCVAFGHGAGFPLFAYLPERTGPWRILAGIYGGAFNGVAAVLVFFVVSGFCIHYRFAAGAPFRTMPFLCRRAVRIAIPMIAAIAISRLYGKLAIEALDAVIWTLYCELIYYALYPALRLGFQKIGVTGCLLLSILISAGMIVGGWQFAYYWQFTIFLTWLVCLPAWLLGCLLAEVIAAGKTAKVGNEIWLWRLAGWAYATFAEIYLFHGPVKIGYPALFFPFIIYLYFWLEREIARFRQVPPPMILEWAGTWSYSIYLVHGMVLVALAPLSGMLEPSLAWIAKLAAILLVSYAFYIAVERPAQQFAREIGRRIDRRQVAPRMP